MEENTTTRAMPVRKTEVEPIHTVTFELPQFVGTFELPDMNAMPTAVAMAIDNSDLEGVQAFFRENVPEFAGVFDIIRIGEFKDFMDAWTKASKVEMGE